MLLVGETNEQGKSQKKGCPYWDCDDVNSCLMTKAGLYIPMPIHIEIFCRTEQYTSCHHYIRGRQLIKEPPWKEAARQDKSRRHFPRFARQVQVTVADCNNKGVPTDLLDGKALALDFSRGGMRIKSKREMPLKEMVFFSFGPSVNPSTVTGRGEIRWCEQHEVTQGFHAGIAFQDMQTSQAVCNHLGIPIL